MAAGKSVAEFRGHSGEVWSVSFSPDGKYLATGSHDKTARLWDIDLITAFLERGKDADFFKTICELSTEFPFRLQGIKMIKAPTRILPIRGKHQPWKAFEIPRPAEVDPVQWWMLADHIEKGTALARDGRTGVAISEFEKAMALDGSLQFDPKARAEEIAASVRPKQ